MKFLPGLNSSVVCLQSVLRQQDSGQLVGAQGELGTERHQQGGSESPQSRRRNSGASCSHTQINQQNTPRFLVQQVFKKKGKNNLISMDAALVPTAQTRASN